MATETFTYKPTDNPQTAVDWIRARGGRAAIAGVTAAGPPMNVGIVFDTGFNTNARLLVAGDKLSYDTVLKTITISLGIVIQL